MKTILSLCDYSGNWSRPYEDDGYEVIRVDLKHGTDVRMFPHLKRPVHGILRRAERRGKALPQALRLALEAVAGSAIQWP